MRDRPFSEKEILKRARHFIEHEPEEAFRREVAELLERQDLSGLRDRFSNDLVFGTGGLRGIIGGGTNRLNVLAVRRTTQGLANRIVREKLSQPSAVIAHDSRRYSDRFAKEAALVLAANGINAHVFPRLAPTPLLSFMVRRLGACAGIVITASHNPPEYNGYKVFWKDGAQIVGEEDERLSAEIGRVGDSISVIVEAEAIGRGLLKVIDEKTIAAYEEAVLRRLSRTDELRARRKELPVVYTPLHGAGSAPVASLFERLGVSYTVVPEQSRPDGDFTWAPVPNPEHPEAFRLAFRLAEKTGALLVLATDPDADRLGAAVPAEGGFRILNGNELGVLFLNYILETRTEKKTLPPTAYIVKTIVTSELQRRIASAHGVRCLDTLTGFKYICGAMRDMEARHPDCEFLFGNEESCGYLIETEVRDKDGVSAAALAAEMALFYQTRNQTLPAVLNAIYARHGLFRELQISRTYPGEEGMAVIERLMQKLRHSPESLLAGCRVLKIKDYLSRTTFDPASKRAVKDIDLPPSDVLQFFLDDGSLVTARPSGTEPKIKFYASLRLDPPFDPAAAGREMARREGFIRSLIETFLHKRAT